MSELLVDRLRRKLDESFCEPWGDFSLRCDLDAGTRFDPAASGVVGGMTVFLVDGGNDRMVYRAELGGLDSADAIDDWLAEQLSALLAAHPRWRRQ